MRSSCGYTSRGILSDLSFVELATTAPSQELKEQKRSKVMYRPCFELHAQVMPRSEIGKRLRLQLALQITLSVPRTSWHEIFAPMIVSCRNQYSFRLTSPVATFASPATHPLSHPRKCGRDLTPVRTGSPLSHGSLPP